ncbi:ATP-binding cassette domain-containing protein [Sharpea azabuensis]|uniref:ATP-binding cassette domain-containing protein n=1 Tax=Sharpea azabuensis TaxID=322505 RepID=UPI00051C646D|nr:ATP-binding cassette domain-containing protein [Sharpea azabuensis]
MTLNNNIKLDLHIHSYASSYKEPNYKDGTSIVYNSSMDNIDVLLNKLIENNISLFSITDHNRYDIDLYKELINKLNLEQYHALNLLHGIEFDVKFESDKDTAHIIAIFDVKEESKEADMISISETIQNNLIQDKNGFYTKDDFENILKSIGLNTILIVHQRCSLDKESTGHNSLSESVSNPYKILKIGYINALEYQKPNVEGILKNNLKNIDSNIALITGSDCHDWKYYPKHDKESSVSNAYFSKCKILPTFKGLLLGLTSPNTRFNRADKSDTNYINSFEINGNSIPLDPSINVIIGENGSGKSTLFNILSDSTLPQYIKSLKKKNKININSSSLHLKVIHQAELIEKFQNNELFQTEELFNTIDTSDFDTHYSAFSSQLKKIIEENIQKHTAINSLERTNFKFNLDYEDASTLYISILQEDLSDEVNLHTERRQRLSRILNLLISEYDNNYYSKEEKLILRNSILQLESIYLKIDKKEKDISLKNKIKNIIIAETKEYNANIRLLSTSEDQEIQTYKKQKADFISYIVNAVQLNNAKSEEVKIPEPIVGKSIKRYNGYVFTRETNYNDIDVSSKFFDLMFTKNYKNPSSLYSITTKNEFQSALYGCKEMEKINEIWNSNFDKFLKWAKDQKSFIKEETTDDSIGNTLGEMSLVYYRFQTNEDNDWDVLMIDQPEDNISNNRIAEKLLVYLNRNRNQKQLILVTHNPLLVVNLDADNIIYLSKTNDTINALSGCLEYENDSKRENILKIVADTLDGGKEMIEKRLKIYE